MQKKNIYIVREKIIYTLLILLVYMIGKNLPLYQVDFSAHMRDSIDAEALLMQTISGDIHQCSIFALGISPYMISSILVNLLTAFRSADAKSKTSQKSMNHITLLFMVVIALLQAKMRVGELQFLVEGYELVLARFIAVLELVTGAMLILWLCGRNKQYGIGGQSALIFVNVIDGIRVTIKTQDMTCLVLPITIAMVVMMVMVFMENSEVRIPVQRISIHNIYADKNYLAVKLNPIGVMPAMFSTAFFMIPQIILSVIGWFVPENPTILWCQENMSLNKPLGVAVYAIILYTLTIGFSRLFLHPDDLTEQYLKSGDSLVGVHAGKDTKKYLSRVITNTSLFSAFVMSVCLVGPMLLQLTGMIDSSFTSLPSSIMILTGVWCNLYSEIIAVKGFESYKSFI